ncbi:MAG: Hsp20/alpha crystallin family protein [Cyanobacteriota bacterium]|nr:Hsp20/alpha crystallin family protein [Cyanobacteriota bacterium]
MAVIRWQPMGEMYDLQKEMNRLFESFAKPSRPNGNGQNSLAFVPAAELHENPEAIHVKFEVPGLEAKDLDVEVTAEAVAISGERREETKTEEKGVTRSEFRYGSFQRVIPLPTRVQNNKVEAEYKNGILHLNLPKAEEEKNKVVKVNIG